MSLPLAPSATLGWAPLALVVLAMLCYALAWRAAPEGDRLPAPALVAGWVMHGVLLILDVGGWGRAEPGARLGFGPVLSLTIWLVIAVHTVESRFVPLPSVRRVLAPAGIAALALAWVFPGGVHPPSNAWAPVHWALGVGAYALFGAAVLHAGLLDAAERQMRRRVVDAGGSGLIGGGGSGAFRPGAMPGAVTGPFAGLPLLKLERITFRFVEVGFIVLTLAVLLGVLTATRWQWSHKIVFSLLGWLVFALLLAGRRLRGWRGRKATRWLYVGSGLLLLAYVGSRFVFEVLLGRAVS